MSSEIDKWHNSTESVIHSIEQFNEIIEGTGEYNPVYRIPYRLIPDLSFVKIDPDEIIREFYWERLKYYDHDFFVPRYDGDLPVLYDEQFATEQTNRWNVELLKRIELPEENDIPVDQEQPSGELISKLIEKSLKLTDDIDNEIETCVFPKMTGKYLADSYLEKIKIDYVEHKLYIRILMLVDIIQELHSSFLVNDLFNDSVIKLRDEFEKNMKLWISVESDFKVVYESRMISILQNINAKLQAKLLAKELIRVPKYSESILPESSAMKTVI